MKDLLQFPALQEALQQVVFESDVDNGTTGAEFLAYWYAQDFVHDPKRDELNRKIARAVLSGTAEEITKLQGELNLLPRPQIMMEWKLIQPIKRIKGTKVASLKRNGETKRFGLEMVNVDTIFISEKAAQLGLLEYEETEEKMLNSKGSESVVVRMKLKKGLIDIAAPIMVREKEVRGKRAYVTPISYKSLQVVGSMMYQEKREEDRLIGFEEIV